MALTAERQLQLWPEVLIAGNKAWLERRAGKWQGTPLSDSELALLLQRQNLQGLAWAPCSLMMVLSRCLLMCPSKLYRVKLVYSEAVLVLSSSSENFRVLKGFCQASLEISLQLLG